MVITYYEGALDAGCTWVRSQQHCNRTIAQHSNGSNETIACVSGPTKPHAGTHNNPYWKMPRDVAIASFENTTEQSRNMQAHHSAPPLIQQNNSVRLQILVQDRMLGPTNISSSRWLHFRRYQRNNRPWGPLYQPSEFLDKLNKYKRVPLSMSSRTIH